MKRHASTTMAWIRALVFALTTQGALCQDMYHGVYVGQLLGTSHEVNATVYAASDDSFHLVGFMYSGTGPDAHFVVGTTDEPDVNGIIVPNEKGSLDKLGAYKQENIIITLPNSKKIKDYKYLSVYCGVANISFGHVTIPGDFVAPKPADVGMLEGNHVTRTGPVVLVDSMVMSITHFNFDGKVTGTFFLAGSGQPVSEQSATKLEDENSSHDALKKYVKKNITLKLPEGAWANYEWFSVYSTGGNSNLAHVEFKELAKTVPLHVMKVLPVPASAGTMPASAGTMAASAGTTPASAGTMPASAGATTAKPASKKSGGSATRPSPLILAVALLIFALLKFTASQSVRESELLVPRVHQKVHKEKRHGDLRASKHGASGILYPDRGNPLVLGDFNYDGTAPGAFFMVGTSDGSSKDGTVLRNEAGSDERLPTYRAKTIVLGLPTGTVVTDLGWFSVYRKDAEMSLVDVAIPSDHVYPKERSIGPSFHLCPSLRGQAWRSA